MEKISCGGFYIGEGLSVEKDENGRNVLSASGGGSAETLYIGIVNKDTGHTDYTFEVYADEEWIDHLDADQLRDRVAWGNSPIPAVVTLRVGGVDRKNVLMLTSYMDRDANVFGLYCQIPDFPNDKFITYHKQYSLF